MLCVLCFPNEHTGSIFFQQFPTSHCHLAVIIVYRGRWNSFLSHCMCIYTISGKLRVKVGNHWAGSTLLLASLCASVLVKVQWEESVYGQFEVLLSSQQGTDLAAVIAHCSISTNRYGSVLASGVFSKSLHACVIHGKCVFLMSWNDWQEVRKCS